MPTGPASGVDVLDVDPRNGGQEALDEVEARDGKLPDTPVGLTGGGGLHLLFRHPDGKYVASRSNALGPGLDVKGDGGYVVIPPSVHASGRAYAWKPGAHPADATLAPWPEASFQRADATAAKTIRDKHATPMLERPTDVARHDTLRNYTMRWANMGLGEVEVRTFALKLADEWGMLAENRGGEVENLVVGAMRKARPREIVSEWTPATLEGVTDPNVGQVDYIIDRLVPKGEVVGIAATFKSGKSLAMYSLALSALRGEPTFGAFAVPRPLRVVIFQEEMPSREDNRRLRRLALGLGIDPADIPAFARSGQLVFFNRVGLDLATSEGVARFHGAVRSANADLVILDSLIAVAGAVELNDNGPVRRMFTAAFLPLTTEGRSLIFLHHKRKAQGGQKGKDADRDSFLGAQAIAAASGRMYSLERLNDPKGATKDLTSFRCALTLFGSWTPEEAVTTVLETRDEGEGTSVTALDEAAQVRSGGVDSKQRAALALARLVDERRTIRRKAALSEIAADLGIGDRTAADGLLFAKLKGWVETERVAGSTTNEQNLIPGPSLDGAL